MQIWDIHDDNPERAEILEEIVVIICWLEVAFGVTSKRFVLNVEVIEGQNKDDQT